MRRLSPAADPQGRAAAQPSDRPAAQGPWQPDPKAYARGRLLARPAGAGAASAGQVADEPVRGLQPLGLASEGERDGLLYVPAGYRPDQPAPLVLMLHGAGGEAHGGIGPFLPLADKAGLILVAPSSRRATWDVIMDGFGPDVASIDAALAQTFERYAVDPARLAVQGFSDGASYALSLGITEGDLFTHVIAFSPGFVAPGAQRGTPKLYVSHGTGDDVLPIDACSRRIVPAAKRAGYDVTYHEFDGGHAMPPEIVDEALTWFRS
jgi:predicted esterase